MMTTQESAGSSIRRRIRGCAGRWRICLLRIAVKCGQGPRRFRITVDTTTVPSLRLPGMPISLWNCDKYGRVKPL